MPASGAPTWPVCLKVSSGQLIGPVATVVASGRSAGLTLRRPVARNPVARPDGRCCRLAAAEAEAAAGGSDGSADLLAKHRDEVGAAEHGAGAIGSLGQRRQTFAVAADGVLGCHSVASAAAYAAVGGWPHAAADHWLSCRDFGDQSSAANCRRSPIRQTPVLRTKFPKHDE